MIKVSVIIPVYNTEEYLDECLQSILNQSLKEIEIICIDDGSTDNSLNILKLYESLDNRITVISQENHGQGYARNRGLEIANGKYIYFMDSDDEIKLNTLKDCYILCEEKSLDFLLFKLINYDDSSLRYYKSSYYNMSKLKNMVGNEIFSYKDLGDVMFNIAVSPVNKLYNKRFLDKINATFPEKLIFEDNIFFWKVLLNAKKIYFYDKYLYIRRRHSNSTTATGDIRFIDSLNINNIIIEMFHEYGIFDEYACKLYNNKLDSLFNRLNLIQDEFKPIFYNKIKEDLIKFNSGLNEEKFLNLLKDHNQIFFKSILNSSNYEEFSLKFDIARLKYKNRKLKENTFELKKLNKNLLNSRSWKITSPLRKIKNILK